VLKMTLIRQKSTEREDIPEGPPIDEELHERCMNAHDVFKKYDPNYILKDVYYPETIEELREIIRDN
jgi:hypothetical protein